MSIPAYNKANARASAIAHVQAPAYAKPTETASGPRVLSSIKSLSFVAVTSFLSHIAGNALAQSSATTSSTEPTINPYTDPCRGADGLEWITWFDMCVTFRPPNPISGCCFYAPKDCWAKIAECAPLVTTTSISSTFTTMTSSTTPETTSGSSSHPLENYQIGLIAAGAVVTTALIARVPAVRNAASNSIEWIRNQLRTPSYAPQQDPQPLDAVVVDAPQQEDTVV